MAQEPFPIDAAGNLDVNTLTGLNLPTESATPMPGLMLSQAASAAMPQPQDLTATGQKLVDQLSASRMGFAGGGMVPGPQLPKPVMPQAPSHGSGVGIPQGPFGTVGERKRADKQALFSSIGGLVNQARDKLYEKKVQSIQRDLDRLGGAITGYKEGIATGNQDMIKQNAGIINEMLRDDPKKAKELSKVFDIDLNPLADKKGKGKDKANEYTDAGKRWMAQSAEAQKNYPQLNPQAAMFMQRMPQTLQPDPRYQQYLEGLKAGAFPKAGEILTFEKGIMDVQEKLASNQFTNETKMKMAENLGQAMLDRTKMQQFGAFLRTQLMQIGANQRAEVMAEALKYRADQVLKGQSDRTNMLRDKLNASTNDDAKKLKLYMDGLDKAAKKNSKDMEDAKKQGDTARMQFLNQQADQIAYQQRLANDRAATMVNLDPSEPPDPKKMGLSDSEYLLFKEIFTDTTQPSGGGSTDSSGDEE